MRINTKNSSFANRGRPLEDLLKEANILYRRNGVAFIHKCATEFIPIRDRQGNLVSCKVESKASFDFIGRYKQYPIAIEAKNTNSDSIRFDAVQRNQYEDMNDFCNEPGTIGFVVVSFGMQRFFAIPWDFWSMAYEIRVRQGNRTDHVGVSAFGQTWSIPRKFSVRADELLPEWEISAYDATYGIDYLKNAEHYIVYDLLKGKANV